jgi:tetratricopeptide (TPR) repeat protein
VLAPANRAAVIWLCRYVEGLPLGIKLAAAQLVDYAIDEVVARVKTDLSVLASTAADLPTHQRSLQAILLRSWADLPPPLAALLAACVVFEGSFCVETAEAVAQGAERALHELANRSLLHIREDRRFVVHEFVRTFLYQYPAAAALVAQAAARHAAYYAHLLDTKGRRKQSTVENFQLLARELPNLRAAWQWALQQPQLDLVQQSIEGLFYTYERLGQFPEALHLVTQATASIQHYLATLLRQPLREQKLPATGGPAEHQGGQPLAATSLSLPDIRRTSAQIAHTKEVLADLHLYTAIIHEMMGDLDGTLSAANAAIALGLELGVPRIEARGYYLLALQAQQRGHFADATRWITYTAELANDHNLVELQITALNLQGILHDMQGHHAAAIAHYKRALPLAIASNDHFQEKLLVNNLGIVALSIGAWEEADAHLQRNLILSKESGNPTKHTYALMNYALLLDAVGLYEQARQTLMHGLQIARTVRHRQSEVYILQFLALVGFHSGQARITINYAEEALALIEEHQFFSLKAAALAFLAHNLLALDEMQRAMTYYTASIDLWRAMNNQLEIGSVLAGYGYAALQLGLVDQALACIEEILPMLDHILTDNATEAMWVVVACYFILEETNDERLYAVLAKGYQRLMQQTETLRKPEIRKAFLHNCYPHRVIVRAMQAYQSTGVSNGFSYTPT